MPVTPNANPASYNDPAGQFGAATPAGIGPQMNDFYWQRQALIELKREQIFMPLADVTAMPKHYGKKIKKYHYLPLLDDRNMNDQGIDAAGNPYNDGNLYGSSKDIGTIPGKLPTLSEHGGRVNRVGFKRIELEGEIEKFGFFEEYTQESVDFDTDAELRMHVNREMLRGAQEITEDALQIDLIEGADTERFPGALTQNSDVGVGDVVTYDDLIKLSIALDDNRTPKQTKVLTGSRMIDTKTIQGGRVMYIGSELLPLLMKMEDYHKERAWIPVQHYASQGTVLNGEEGSIGPFRIVVAQEMTKWEGAGDGGIDVHPMLVVGQGAFTTIGFQTDGKSVKWKIFNKKPGMETADRTDPYGETGFMSIKWYYGTMLLRPERLALFHTAAA